MNAATAVEEIRASVGREFATADAAFASWADHVNPGPALYAAVRHQLGLDN